jgi:hypothetical protein
VLGLRTIESLEVGQLRVEAAMAEAEAMAEAKAKPLTRDL